MTGAPAMAAIQMSFEGNPGGLFGDVEHLDHRLTQKLAEILLVHRPLPAHGALFEGRVLGP